jgi:ABC-type uncharacterized transport system auxiliary subunit
VIVRLPARAVPLLWLCLSGCSGLFKSNAQPEQIYFLRAPPAQGATAGAASPGAAAAAADGATASAASLARMGVSIRVGHPLAAPGLDTAHIMLVQADHRMNFFAGSRWPAPLPDVVEALTVQTLRASNAWASVEDSSSPFPSDYLLQVAVRRFEADYAESGSAPAVHVVLDCTVGRREGRDIIATFVASGTTAAAANRLSDVVAAFEQASGAALVVLSQQAAQTVRSDAQRAAQNGEKPVPSATR